MGRARAEVGRRAPELESAEIGSRAVEAVGEIGHRGAGIDGGALLPQAQHGGREPGRVGWRQVVGEDPLALDVPPVGFDTDGGGQVLDT